MDILTKQCEVLSKFGIDGNCVGNPDIGYPRLVVLGDPNTAITAAGAIPTPTEIQTYLDNGHGIAFKVARGNKQEPTVEFLPAEDTLSGVQKINSETEGITVTLVELTNSVLKAIKQNNLNFTQMRLFWVDSNNLWHGETTGYMTPSYIPTYSHAGKGANQAMITKAFEWEVEKYSYLNISDPDSDYMSLTTTLSGIYTETAVANYTIGDVTGYDLITGWNKVNFATLYFATDLVPTVISIYSSDAARTAGTGEVATIDLTDPTLAVTEANSSGFGGSLDGFTIALQASAKWNVTYSEA